MLKFILGIIFGFIGGFIVGWVFTSGGNCSNDKDEEYYD